MELIGTKTISEKLIISEVGVQVGEIIDITFVTVDVGTVYGVRLSTTSTDSFLFAKIKIVKKDEPPVVITPKEGNPIMCPKFCEVIFAKEVP